MLFLVLTCSRRPTSTCCDPVGYRCSKLRTNPCFDSALITIFELSNTPSQEFHYGTVDWCSRSCYYPMIVFLCQRKDISGRGLVSLSTNCSSVWIFLMLIAPNATCQRKWWSLLLMCFVRGRYLYSYTISRALELSSKALHWILGVVPATVVPYDRISSSR